MNNKGQSLVLFVIILPFVVLLFIFLIDIANLSMEKIRLNSIAEEALQYLKEEKDIEQVKEYINKNDSSIEIITIENDEIYIGKYIKPYFGDKTYKIEIHKKG